MNKCHCKIPKDSATLFCEHGVLKTRKVKKLNNEERFTISYCKKCNQQFKVAVKKYQEMNFIRRFFNPTLETIIKVFYYTHEMPGHYGKHTKYEDILR